MSAVPAALPWCVLKYGGTSVATARTWAQIVARVRVLQPTHRVWLVVSAVSRVTNLLLAAIAEAVSPTAVGAARFTSFAAVAAIHEELAAALGLPAADFAPAAELLAELRRLLEGIALTGEASARLRARVAAHGELLSSSVGAAYLARALAPAAVARVDSRALLVSTERGDEGSARGDDVFLEADVAPSSQPERADAAAAGATVVIAQGFIASTPDGATCLLGRGGSDTSGALFAALTAASHLEIWTDVNGMFTADPRFVPRARLIRALTYREAQELAAMGARVLHPRCLCVGRARWGDAEAGRSHDRARLVMRRMCERAQLTPPLFPPRDPSSPQHPRGLRGRRRRGAQHDGRGRRRGADGDQR